MNLHMNWPCLLTGTGKCGTRQPWPWPSWSSSQRLHLTGSICTSWRNRGSRRHHIHTNKAVDWPADHRTTHS